MCSRFLSNVVYSYLTVTIISGFIMLVLFVSELQFYLTKEVSIEEEQCEIRMFRMKSLWLIIMCDCVLKCPEGETAADHLSAFGSVHHYYSSAEDQHSFLILHTRYSKTTERFVKKLCYIPSLVCRLNKSGLPCAVCLHIYINIELLFT